MATDTPSLSLAFGISQDLRPLPLTLIFLKMSDRRLSHYGCISRCPTVLSFAMTHLLFLSHFGYLSLCISLKMSDRCLSLCISLKMSDRVLLDNSQDCGLFQLSSTHRVRQPANLLATLAKCTASQMMHTTCEMHRILKDATCTASPMMHRISTIAKAL